MTAPQAQLPVLLLPLNAVSNACRRASHEAADASVGMVLHQLLEPPEVPENQLRHQMASTFPASPMDLEASERNRQRPIHDHRRGEDRLAHQVQGVLQQQRRPPSVAGSHLSMVTRPKGRSEA